MPRKKALLTLSTLTLISIASSASAPVLGALTLMGALINASAKVTFSGSGNTCNGKPCMEGQFEIGGEGQAAGVFAAAGIYIGTPGVAGMANRPLVDLSTAKTGPSKPQPTTSPSPQSA